MEDIYPLRAASTLPRSREAAGIFPPALSAVAFDAVEELLYAAGVDGRVTAMHAPSLERFSAVHAHGDAHGGAHAILPHRDGGVGGYGGAFGGAHVSLSAERATFHSSGGVMRWGVDVAADDPTNDPVTCGAIDAPHALGSAGGRAFIGRVSPTMTTIDIATGKISATDDVSGARCERRDRSIH